MRFEQQNGRCAICGGTGERVHKGVKSGLYIDHDHDTGKIRGLLCHDCNSGLGHFRDNPALLLKALRYLKNAI